MVAVWGSVVAMTALSQLPSQPKVLHSFVYPLDVYWEKTRLFIGNHFPDHRSKESRPPGKGDNGAGQCVSLISEEVGGLLKGRSLL